MTGSIVTIGLFDGVHLGHQAVIKRVVDNSTSADLKSVVVTFNKHPLAVLRPAHTHLLLLDPKSKVEIIKSLGIKQVIMLGFTKEFSQLDPETFLETVIIPLRPRDIIIGKDFRFGRDRGGDIFLLKKYMAKKGVRVITIPLLTIEGRKASSSTIRRLIQSGDIAECAKMLGRFPAFAGDVVKGESTGRKLGFPTANLRIAPNICLPKNGVYAGIATIRNERALTVVNVGIAPTFSVRRESLIEAHIIGYKGQIYGQRLSVEIHTRLRDEVKFKDADALVAQITKDAQMASDMISL